MQLTQERLNELLSYQPETGVFTWKVSRGAGKPGCAAGTRCKRGYVRICIDGVLHLAHRLAWVHQYGVFPVGLIDHIDGDKSNNRIENLRSDEFGMNQQNIKRTSSRNKSGFLGVHFEASSGKWRAGISVMGKTKQIGRFCTPSAAHAAYLEAKRKHHPFCTI